MTFKDIKQRYGNRKSYGNFLLRAFLWGTKRIYPAKLFVQLKYWAALGRWPDLETPRTYNEKLNWLKLHDHNPKYTMLVDKVRVKEYVAGILGEEHVIPLYGTWEHFDDIDFDALPGQFVLKCNHDSGLCCICTDKSTFDLATAKRKLEARLKINFYWGGREWPYKNVKPCILAEKYMKDPKTPVLNDYKFFCFDGKVRALFVVTGRGIDTRLDFFDENFNHLPFERGHPVADKTPERPEKFDEMKRYAELLSTGILHVRVDFYEVDGKVYFGEFTFYPGSGLEVFDPEVWDYRFGELLTLPAGGKRQDLNR